MGISPSDFSPMSTTTCLSVILTTVPGDHHLFGGQVLRGCRLGGLFAVEVRQRRGKVRRVVVRLGGAAEALGGWLPRWTLLAAGRRDAVKRGCGLVGRLRRG